ncbi:MAG: serine hydrolase domain-containing protein [Ilumatobacter sp.]
MRRRIALALALTAGVSAASCAAGRADDTVSRPVSSIPDGGSDRTPSSDDDGVRDGTGGGSRSGVESMPTDADVALDDEGADSASAGDARSTGSAPEATADDATVGDGSVGVESVEEGTGDVGAPAAGDEEEVDEGEGATEEPSFGLGPDVVLDADVARFPTDDAGIGGEPTTPVVDDAGGAAGDAVDEAQAPAVSGWSGVDRFLESILIRTGNTAASVAVSIDGDVVHSAAFGVRDPITGDRAEPQDRFRIASISKPITAITVMALVEDGVIGLDDPLGDAIARHVGLAEANGASANLTLRQLLTHRSGFGKYDGTFFRGGAADCIDAARAGLSSGVGGGGGGYVYSNMNFCVAGLAIEAVTGLDYEQAVYRYLLTPLGITGMRLAPTFDPGPDEIQHVTTPGRNYMETLGGAGAWVATPTDLVTIFDSLDVDSGGFKPLSVETVLAMLIPPGGTLGQQGYGLGVISYGDDRYGHTGTIESTHAMVLNRGDGVIWAITVAGQFPGESTALERIMNDAFAAGGFVAG